MAGFGRIVKEEKNSETKEHMLDYLVALFDDANDFSWDAAKASHAVLLCRMEQGEINSYSEVDKGIIFPVCLVIAVKKLVRKISSPCPVNIITRALVTSSKHTKLGVWFIDIFAQHLVRDKQDSSKKRTIMDLSWPKGASVNDGVLKDTYLGTDYTLTYPSIDHITQSLVKLDPAAQIYKIDISRAFRQIKIDPADIDLLGLKIENHYFLDRSVPFGFRHGSQIFQRCTDAIRFIMARHGFPTLWNYIDDLIYTLTHP